MAKKINVKKVKNKMREKTSNIKENAKSKFGGNLKTLIVILFHIFSNSLPYTIQFLSFLPTRYSS